MFIKILLFCLVLYLVVWYLTKPFRDFAKRAERMRNKFQQKTEQTQTDGKTDNLGEYIDFEEIEE